jgi:hypothetical protein
LHGVAVEREENCCALTGTEARWDFAWSRAARDTAEPGGAETGVRLRSLPLCHGVIPRNREPESGREKPIENRRRLCEIKAGTRGVAASCPVGRTRPLTDTHSLRRRRSTGLRDDALREDKKLINDGVSARETESETQKENRMPGGASSGRTDRRAEAETCAVGEK